jgi:large subunit ribosomal protein L6
MSRVANSPVSIPAGVEINISGQKLKIKGGNGQFEYDIHDDVVVAQEDGELKFAVREGSKNVAIAGTMRALTQNMVTGVKDGFEKKLTLIGVGYRAKASGQKVEMNLGFSHPVIFEAPEGITLETPSNTEIVVKGCDKQKVGQVAANIRSFRPPEPYKGKGVRYSDEVVIKKETKKK